MDLTHRIELQPTPALRLVTLMILRYIPQFFTATIDCVSIWSLYAAVDDNRATRQHQ